ncbi:MAG: hypothetical protein ACQ9ET_00085 [Nitrosomonadaceae bacterium]
MTDKKITDLISLLDQYAEALAAAGGENPISQHVSTVSTGLKANIMQDTELFSEFCVLCSAFNAVAISSAFHQQLIISNQIRDLKNGN